MLIFIAVTLLSVAFVPSEGAENVTSEGISSENVTSEGISSENVTDSRNSTRRLFADENHLRNFVKDFIHFYDYKKAVFMADETLVDFFGAWVSHLPVYTSVVELGEDLTLEEALQRTAKGTKAVEGLAVVLTRHSHWIMKVTFAIPTYGDVSEFESFQLWETYFVKNEQVRSSKIYGEWSRELKVRVSSKGFVSRRMDLLGTKLKCLAEGDYKYNGLISTGNDTWQMYGLYASVVNVLSSYLNFTCIISPAPDRNWGSLNADGSWSGLVGELVEERADMIVVNLDHSIERSRAIDFLIPFENNGFSFIIKKVNDIGSVWEIYLGELAPLAWLCSALSLVLLSLFYFLVTSSTTAERVSVLDSVHFVFGAIAGQGSTFVPTTLSGRITFFTTFLFTVLLSTFYNSALYSMLTIKLESLPFENIEALLQDGSYTFQLVKGWSVETSLRESDNKILKQVYANAVENNGFPPNRYEAIAKVHEGKHAFILSQRDLGELDTLDTLTIIPGQFFVAGSGFAVSKDSPLKDVLNAGLISLFNNGLLDRSKSKWIPQRFDNTERKINPIELKQTLSLFSFFLLLCALALIVMGVEKQVGSRKKKKKNEDEREERREGKKEERNEK